MVLAMATETVARAATDIDLTETVAGVLGAPRSEPPDSFILHAPLELLARAALLPHVSPDLRGAARDRIEAIAPQFEGFADAAAIPAFEGTTHAAERCLRDALRDGDLEAAASAGQHLGRTLDAEALTATVGDLLTPSLAAAAHGPIFLHHLPRALPRSPVAGARFGTLAREVARHPGWELRWQERDLVGSGDLVTSLAHVQVLGSPGSNSIHPLMAQADESGLAAETVGPAIGPGTDAMEAERAILRVATASMLVDDPEHAPYGWTHCLTIPPGILSTLRSSNDPLRVLALAATHVVGFRTGLGSAPLAALPGPNGAIRSDGLVPGIDRPAPERIQAAIDHAATHHDAHLVKYVVSCLDASRRDPEGAHQHLAAATHLSDWWHAARG